MNPYPNPNPYLNPFPKPYPNPDPNPYPKPGVANTTASLDQYFCSQGRKVAAHDKLTLFYLIFLKFFDDFFENLIFYPLCYTCQKHIPRNVSDISTRLTSPEKFSHPKNIFPPLKKVLNLTIVKRAAQACQVGRVLDTPALNHTLTRTITYTQTVTSNFTPKNYFYIVWSSGGGGVKKLIP